ncbi:Crp/Fnr family transcriptional regulator [Chitinilyticum litopenaei]|uniref:Crp/Fnr family transcriptional regulator n=1 Tax=Chitinilyticum litopenaei TaxID=1121276 RepID=UPI0004097051|nr:Crp/Fnr family transcriptional regulator [Chitinilyticum litopenaei]
MFATEPFDLFAGLPESARQAVARLARLKRLPQGQLLFAEGEAAQHSFVLQRGRLRVSCSNERGKEFVIGFIEPGSSLGEAAMLLQEPRQMNARAEEDCELLVIQRADLLQLMDALPELRQEMLMAALRLARHFSDMVKSLALTDVYGRVRALLESLKVDEGGQCVVREPLTQQAIAERVGASREMITKVMKELVFGGYVSIEQRRIVLHQKLPERF